MLAMAVALIPLGTAFTFPCVTALLSRVVSQRERGLYMGMQQTYGGITRAIAPVLYGRAFDTLGVSSPYYFSSAIIAGHDISGIWFGQICAGFRFTTTRSCRGLSYHRRNSRCRSRRRRARKLMK